MSTAEAPAVSVALPQVRLKIARRSSHPWIFQKMVEKPATRLPPGSVVDMLDRDGQWVGRGFYNGHSRIALRVLTADPAEAIDDAFFARRLGRAIALRRDWLGLDAVSRRLPPGAFRRRRPERAGGRSLRLDRGAGVLRRRHVPLPRGDPGGPGEPLPRRAASTGSPRSTSRNRNRSTAGRRNRRRRRSSPRHGVRFRVAPGSKHKTGFFLDQRDNRRLLAVVLRRQARARPVLQHRRLRRLRQGAGRRRGGGRRRSRRASDRPGPAERQPEPGARPLRAGRPVSLAARHHAPAGQRFDVVVLDPAKQTRDREEVDFALKRYLDMNRLALQAVAPGGMFLTCSCTGLVERGEFLETLRRAAWQAGRMVQVLRSRRGRGGPSLPAARARRGGISRRCFAGWNEPLPAAGARTLPVSPCLALGPPRPCGV